MAGTYIFLLRKFFCQTKFQQMTSDLSQVDVAISTLLHSTTAQGDKPPIQKCG